ncbi:hypothetical protein [Mycobacterium sp. NPDC050041]|uniref:hypothetical protein n=1 Tax=Mycobacterium sp. NPDC050041 TaxID=3364293 RepID=UPI003C2DC745
MTANAFDEIDRELAARTDDVASMSATLVELDAHPGLAHLRRYSPSGLTAQRWAHAEETLRQSWDILAQAMSILDAASSARRRSDPDDVEFAELRHKLRELPKTLVDIRVVTRLLDAVDEIDSLVAHGLAPIMTRLDEAGVGYPPEIVELLDIAATDPLSLTASDVTERLTVIAEWVALRENWAEALTDTAAAIDQVGAAFAEATGTRFRVEQRVLTAPLPTRPNPEPDLRRQLESLVETNPAALQEVQRRIDAALQQIRADEAVAQGLLDRRDELTGRLRGYQAKAARLGLVEDADLVSSMRIAAGLLSRRPCDLSAVTRAVADYQQAITEKRGRVG